MSAGKVIVPLRNGSDGDATHHPTSPTYTQVNPPMLYLEKIGLQWMKSRNEALPHLSYALERLPVGYTLWQRPRVKDPTHIDKYLYGHPNQIPFDSPNRFFPHFKYLMENGGSNIGCPCTVCKSKGGVVPALRASHGSKNGSRNGGSGTSTPKGKAASRQHKGRLKLVTPGMDASRVDEEGTPDVYRNLIDKLRKQGTLDEAIMEPMSMDWRAEQEIFPTTLQTLKDNPQWLPRKGDIVLFVREIPDGMEICRNKTSGEFKLRDITAKTWVSHPWWEAGLVGQTPAENVDLEDVVMEGEKKKNVSYSGVRVEPLPSPNGSDKSLSKRYRYVPVHHTRPFVFWKDYLNHFPEEKWHPTIKNALTAMSSFSLMGKHHFRGIWPEAQIYCHGIYIGSEMIAVGDTVRLTPKSGASSCTDVLTIKSIRLKLTNLDAANSNDYDEGRPYNSSVQIYGRAHTSDVQRSSKEWISADPLPTIIRDENPWRHPLHPASKEMQVPLSRILGRLFESDVMTLWLLPNSIETAFLDLSQGLTGLQEARTFSRANDKRITEQFGATWFWGDTRAEALDLRTVNGLEISKFDTGRDPKEWRKQIKAAENLNNLAQTQTLKEETSLRAAARNLRAFAAPASVAQKTGNPPPRNQCEARSVSASAGGSGTVTNSSGSGLGAGGTHPNRKRPKVVDLSSEDEEEFRQYTKIVGEVAADTPTGGKKKKVMVVID